MYQQPIPANQNTTHQLTIHPQAPAQWAHDAGQNLTDEIIIAWLPATGLAHV